MSHNHSHSGPCGHHHHHHHDDDSHVKPDEGDQDSLYSSVDRDRIVTLNEIVQGSGSKIIKPWSARLDVLPELLSDTDDQIIIHIPFTSSVKLSTFLLRSNPSIDLTPSCIKLYKNLPESSLNFDDIINLPTSKIITTLQSIPTTSDVNQIVPFPLAQVKWTNTNSITVFVESSIGGDQTGLQFLGFKGKNSGFTTNSAPTSIVYESAPQLKDHAKLGSDSLTSAQGFGH
ncbi:uncharacterized protein MEPE_05977 [Melanopsichium pennsylvanicum]|uniref:PITH domain-containing protein n=1 Tax=Melanopsichium pennsylvanicum TaxID=63383 RepID=A0AAJ4XSW2_9BASI|nr:uncharacterized protein MEPE_05977 [Melanopsichium pennsylvanicum]